MKANFYHMGIVLKINFFISEFEDIWSPRIAGQINDMQIKLVKVKGNFIWH